MFIESDVEGNEKIYMRLFLNINLIYKYEDYRYGPPI